MRILFVADTQIGNVDLLGIRKKLSSQRQSLGNLGDTTIVMRDTSPNLFRGGAAVEKLFFWFRLYLRYRNNRFDLIYVRDLTVLSGLFEAMFFISQRRALRVVELPTYPLSSNNIKGLSVLSYVYNQFTRNISWRHFIDEIAYNGNHVNSIFGVKAKRINHFVGLEELKIYSSDEKIPVFAFVSSLQSYHGIDRILKSFSESNVSARLLVVGGTEVQIADLRNQYISDDRIDFFPFLEDEELDKVLKRATIGISAMSLYRVGLTMTSGLKVAEYAARGLHIVLGYEDETFNNKDYCFCVENDSSLIPFDRITDWYLKSDYSHQQIRNDILSENSWIEYIKTRISQ